MTCKNCERMREILDAVLEIDDRLHGLALIQISNAKQALQSEDK